MKKGIGILAILLILALSLSCASAANADAYIATLARILGESENMFEDRGLDAGKVASRDAQLALEDFDPQAVLRALYMTLGEIGDREVRESALRALEAIREKKDIEYEGFASFDEAVLAVESACGPYVAALVNVLGDCEVLALDYDPKAWIDRYGLDLATVKARNAALKSADYAPGDVTLAVYETLGGVGEDAIARYDAILDADAASPYDYPTFERAYRSLLGKHGPLIASLARACGDYELLARDYDWKTWFESYGLDVEQVRARDALLALEGYEPDAVAGAIRGLIGEIGDAERRASAIAKYDEMIEKREAR